MEFFKPDAPLFRDPIFDGAADPTIIWNRQEKAWWILYTNRRATAPTENVSYVHGTDIGIASSADNGKTWLYRGIIEGLEFERGRNTFWAPEIIYEQGQYHMYVSYVKGIMSTWKAGRDILHYTSDNLWDWTFHGIIDLSSSRVIDACIFRLPNGKYKMWYKNEMDNSHTYSAISDNLFDWTVLGVEIDDCQHEGANVFAFAGKYWMITDPADGLAVYCSDDLYKWERKSNILVEGSTRTDDGTQGAHADVLVCDDKAYIFYFTHPELTREMRISENTVWEYKYKRSSIQVASLSYDGDELVCERDNPQIFLPDLA